MRIAIYGEYKTGTTGFFAPSPSLSPVRHVSHALPVTRFLDDCHLDSERSRLLALIDRPQP